MQSLSDYKAYLNRLFEESKSRFTQAAPVREIVRSRATQIDTLLQSIWNNSGLADSGLALLAVGGYGRGELHPFSDIDIAIVLAEEPARELELILQRFVTTLWDLGLDIGHSVRTLTETFDTARQDVTVMTNLLESRLIAGNQDLFSKITEVVRSDELWQTGKFFAEKINEQKTRYRKFDDALQRLEPNVKESPGGLRDIQTISWVANRHFQSTGLHSLLDHNFLTQAEYDSLAEGEEFLWRIRCALHFLTGRHEDRLSFDHQKAVAEMAGL